MEAVQLASPFRVLTQLAKLCAGEGAECVLKPEEVARAMDAVKTILSKGLPDKDHVYSDRRIPEGVERLAAFYASSAEVSGAGDRLYREEVARLAHGLADVADRLRLAAVLREARRSAGFSIRELSRFSGVDHSYISRVERGAVPRPSRAVMDRLSASLGINGWREEADGAVSEAPGTAGANGVDRPGADLAELGLHRAAVRSLLRAARDLPDEHLELLEAQARAMRERVRKARK